MPNDSLCVCRRCGEVISIEDGNCPHCGQSVRGTTPYVVVAVIGLVVAGFSLLNIGELLGYGILGLLFAIGAGYVLYEKRQRIKAANERDSESRS